MRVLAVIPAYRAWHLVEEALASLARQEMPPVEIVVANNAADDPAPRPIAGVRMLTSPHNAGYAGAVNAGIAAADTDFDAVLVVTQDCVLRDGALDVLRERLADAPPTLGAVGPLLAFRTVPDRVWSVGASIDTTLWRTEHHGAGSRVVAWHMAMPRQVTWIDGACMLLPRAALAEVGPLSEEFFMYYEEVDFCLRLRERGYTVECVPSAVAWQEPGGHSVDGAVRNRLLLARRAGGRGGAIRAAASLLVEELDPAFHGKPPHDRGLRLGGLADFVRGRRTEPHRHARPSAPPSLTPLGRGETERPPPRLDAGVTDYRPRRRAATRQRVILVVEAPVATPVVATGYSPRLFHFAGALRERYDVIVLAFDRGNEWGSAVDARAGVDAVVGAVHRSQHPMSGAGRLAQARRLAYMALPRPPIVSYPGRLAELTAMCETLHPALVIMHLPRFLPYLRSVPDEVKVVALLEERDLSFADVRSLPGRARLVARRDRARVRSAYEHGGRRCAAGVVISDAERTGARELGWSGDLHVLRHGVDLDYFAPVAEGIPAEHDAVVVADFRAARNANGAEALLASGGRAATPHRWLLAGAGSEAFAGRAGVTCTGPMLDVRDAYAAGQVVVVPATSGHGVKTTVLQAWASRRPVVMTRHATTGLPVRDGDNALVGDDVRAVLPLLDGLLGSASRREAIARAGRETAARACDIRHVANEFVELCSRAVAS